jgi:translation initiation factor 3 subunit D
LLPSGGGSSFFLFDWTDLLSVNENSGEQFDQNEESINSMGKLCQEATVINQNFSQQVLSHTNDGNYDFEEPNPFAADGSAVASSGYKYRRFDLDSDLSLICRCEIDAIKIAKDGSQQFIHTRALNEYDPKLTGDWRKNLERRGGVIANELKNNASKMARWTAAAVLAGVQSLELGFVSRVAPRDNMNHVILATQSTKPSEISSQMSLNFDNMWSIVRTLINSVFNHPSDGKFLLLKDSTAANLKLYKIPDNAFAEDLSGDSAAQGGQLILK